MIPWCSWLFGGCQEEPMEQLCAGFFRFPAPAKPSRAAASRAEETPAKGSLVKTTVAAAQNEVDQVGLLPLRSLISCSLPLRRIGRASRSSRCFLVRDCRRSSSPLWRRFGRRSSKRRARGSWLTIYSCELVDFRPSSSCRWLCLASCAGADPRRAVGMPLCSRSASGFPGPRRSSSRSTASGSKLSSSYRVAVSWSEVCVDCNVRRRAKVSKYGDRVLETIELTLEEFKRTNRSGGGADSGEAAKRRRGSAGVGAGGAATGDDDFSEATAELTKRPARARQNPIFDLDLDGPDAAKTAADPQIWGGSSAGNLFQEYAFRGEWRPYSARRWPL